MPTGQPQTAHLAGSALVTRLALLIAGTTAIGMGTALLLRAELGMLPMDVLHVGIAEQLGLSVGGGIAVAQAALLLLFVPLRVRIGPGTIAGLLLPALSADLALAVLPAGAPVAARLLFLATGGLLFCCGVALYLSTQLGPMPRDGILTAFPRHHPHRLGAIRAGLDIAFLALGGTLLVLNAVPVTDSVGLATLVLAFASGPVIGALITMLGRARE